MTYGKPFLIYKLPLIQPVHNVSQWEGVTTDKELELHLSKIRQDGFYKTISGEGQIMAMAVPVNIQPHSALGCYAPIFRCDEERAEEIIVFLKEVAKKIENEMFEMQKKPCQSHI